MINSARPVKPVIPPFDPANIPAQLKAEKCWFPWRAGSINEHGKFPEIPVNPSTGRNVNPIDPANWLTFQEALNAYHNGIGHGLGVALSEEHPITVAGEVFYLTAIDLDNCGDRMSEYSVLWRQLGRPYVRLPQAGKVCGCSGCHAR